ncbi:MAG: DUF4112 domain-containing protein [Chthoniobacterales bacterium]
MPPDPDYIEVEVVSRGGKKTSQVPSGNGDPLFALIAKLMDNFFLVPGTNIRFGLDPIIGLIPGLGDTSGALISALLIVRGARAGLPRIVLTRMALNVLINTVGGTIPVLGDVFSVWFKSNQLNYALYQKHAGVTTNAAKTDWLFVIGLVAILLLVVGAIITLSMMLLVTLWKSLANSRV